LRRALTRGEGTGRMTRNELEMRKQRARVWEQARDVLNGAEGREMKDVEMAHFKALRERYEELTAELAASGGAVHEISAATPREWVASADKELRTSLGRLTDPVDPQRENRGRRGPDREYRCLRADENFAAHVADVSGASREMRELDTRRLLHGWLTGQWNGAEAEQRTLMSMLDVKGGFAVPAVLASQWIDLARARMVTRAAGAHIFPMDGPRVTIPRLDKDPVAGWRVENGAIAGTSIDLGAITLHAKSLAASVRITEELRNDAPLIGEMVERALTEAIALEFDRAALLGTGSNGMPVGIVNETGVLTENINGVLDYSALSEALEKLRTNNVHAAGSELALICSPREAGLLDRHRDLEERWVGATPACQDIPILPTSLLPVNLGSGTNESIAILGDWREMLHGVRDTFRMEAGTTGDDFQNMRLTIRAHLRGDVHVRRPRHFIILRQLKPS
jgi:HK97 family phage major capsid protein